mmetsp:Transcript_20388/g.40093  ORF Transcript_20388/g.40093 Transcript_20388/m.40093 type:complete len:247 (+) Transcript_20388:256-996(+)
MFCTILSDGVNVHSITTKNITLSDSDEDILDHLNGLIDRILWFLLESRADTNLTKSIVQNGHSNGGGASVCGIAVARTKVGSNGIVAGNVADTLIIEARDNGKCIVREEALVVKSIGQELRSSNCGEVLLVVVLVHDGAELEVVVQSINVVVTATAGNDGLACELQSTVDVAALDIVALGKTFVRGNKAIILTSNSDHSTTIPRVRREPVLKGHGSGSIYAGTDLQTRVQYAGALRRSNRSHFHLN